jgi:hypothetical protein
LGLLTCPVFLIRRSNYQTLKKIKTISQYYDFWFITLSSLVTTVSMNLPPPASELRIWGDYALRPLGTELQTNRSHNPEDWNLGYRRHNKNSILRAKQFRNLRGKT